MSPRTEEIVRIPSDDEFLHGVLHRAGGDSRWALLFAAPFAEEEKCAHRSLVETAWALSSAGISCLRFDYRGCGDSPGEFHDYDLNDWVQDTTEAALFVRERLGEEIHLGVLGLRLGAAIAMQAADLRDVFDYAVLWEPVISGQKYLKMNLRRSLIKAMMTAEEKFEADEIASKHSEGSIVDFDGYAVTQRMREQIERMDLVDDPPEFTGPTLIVHLGPRQQVSPELHKLADGMIKAEVEAVRQEPFWQRIGLTSPAPAIEATELWLAELQTHSITPQTEEA
ncbi:MAG: alpha/beta fold hydrolase [Armatimonadota bacterium]